MTIRNGSLATAFGILPEIVAIDNFPQGNNEFTSDSKKRLERGNFTQNKITTNESGSEKTIPHGAGQINTKTSKNKNRLIHN